MAADKHLLAKTELGLAPLDAARALAEAVMAAGQLARSMLEAGVRTWTKGHDSPVTDADIATDALLRERLHALAPTYGWQSEESVDIPDRSTQQRRWVVDPIDGTRSFIKKQADWSVAAALVEEGRPIAAALYAPVTDELFVAAAGAGATRNGVRVRANGKTRVADAHLAGPRGTLDRLARTVDFHPVPRIHSLALRFARVAAGDIDAAIASAHSRDWDLAAADLLVHEAGGSLTTLAGKRLVYDNPEAEHPSLAAAGADLHGALLEALGRIEVQTAGAKAGIQQV
jgi:myo-inositol-1(or 4)-monophosphatase